MPENSLKYCFICCEETDCFILTGCTPIRHSLFDDTSVDHIIVPLEEEVVDEVDNDGDNRGPVARRVRRRGAMRRLPLQAPAISGDQETQLHDAGRELEAGGHEAGVGAADPEGQLGLGGQETEVVAAEPVAQLDSVVQDTEIGVQGSGRTSGGGQAPG
ncbi:unnamed protein product, partial [Allacma fusca]